MLPPIFFVKQITFGESKVLHSTEAIDGAIQRVRETSQKVRAIALNGQLLSRVVRETKRLRSMLQGEKRAAELGGYAGAVIHELSSRQTSHHMDGVTHLSKALCVTVGVTPVRSDKGVAVLSETSSIMPKSARGG
jgi:hypothetical protein